MQSIRVGRIAATVAAASLILAAGATAADAPGPTATVSASVSPNHLVPGLTNKHGMPIKLKVSLKINHPSGSRYRLDKVTVKFPAGVGAPHGELFPSCSVAKLKAARGRLSACPKGSRIGGGLATGTAVDLGVTSTGTITMFNGPHGKSITFNVNTIHPALINDTFSAPLKKISGRYGYMLTSPIPGDLQNILDGPIIVRSINVSTFATRVVHGVKRGYVEAFKCPKSHKAPLHADFSFNSDSGATATTSADTNIACH
jgi:hypothetical protein